MGNPELGRIEPAEFFLKRIKSNPELAGNSQENQNKLIHIVQDGRQVLELGANKDDARVRLADRAETLLVQGNEGLVRKILKRETFSGRQDWEDLAQAGRLGLVKAIRKFDFGKDYEFSTYAGKTIFGYMVRQMEQDDGIKSHDLDDRKRIKKEIERRTGTEERLDYGSISTQLGIKRTKVVNLLLTENPVSADKLVTDYSSDTLAELIPDSSASFEDDVLSKVAWEEVINSGRASLTKREGEIIKLVLAGNYRQDLDKIFGCSRSNITFLISGIRRKTGEYFVRG